jgi:hypothetical protein
MPRLGVNDNGNRDLSHKKALPVRAGLFHFTVAVDVLSTPAIQNVSIHFRLAAEESLSWPPIRRQIPACAGNVLSAPVKRDIPDCSGNLLLLHPLICYSKLYRHNGVK